MTGGQGESAHRTLARKYKGPQGSLLSICGTWFEILTANLDTNFGYPSMGSGQNGPWDRDEYDLLSLHLSDHLEPLHLPFHPSQQK